MSINNTIQIQLSTTVIAAAAIYTDLFVQIVTAFLRGGDHLWRAGSDADDAVPRQILTLLALQAFAGDLARLDGKHGRGEQYDDLVGSHCVVKRAPFSDSRPDS